MPEFIPGEQSRFPCADRPRSVERSTQALAAIEILLAEFTMVMRQTRTAKLSDITPKFVMEAKSPIMMRDNRFGFNL